MSKKQGKKQTNQAKQTKKLLEKINPSLSVLVDQDVTDINAAVEASRHKEWPCLLCFVPSMQRGWSVPQTNPEGVFYLTAIYGICEHHSKDTAANRELVIGNVQSNIDNYRKTHDPDYEQRRADMIELQRQMEESQMKELNTQVENAMSEKRSFDTPETSTLTSFVQEEGVNNVGEFTSPQSNQANQEGTSSNGFSN